MKEYDWLHCILKCNKSDAADTIDIANIAVLCSKAEEIVIEMTGENKLGEAEWKSLTEGMDTIQELGLSMKIGIQLWPTQSDWDRMYQMAFSMAMNRKIYCQQREGGKLLLFSVNGGQDVATENTTVSFDDHVRKMIPRLAEAVMPKEETSEIEQLIKV